MRKRKDQLEVAYEASQALQRIYFMDHPRSDKKRVPCLISVGYPKHSRENEYFALFNWIAILSMCWGKGIFTNGRFGMGMWIKPAEWNVGLSLALGGKRWRLKKAYRMGKKDWGIDDEVPSSPTSCLPLPPVSAARPFLFVRSWPVSPPGWSSSQMNLLQSYWAGEGNPGKNGKSNRLNGFKGLVLPARNKDSLGKVNRGNGSKVWS